MRHVMRLAVLFGIAGLLGGCDRCGDLLKLNIFGEPSKSCSSDKPQG